MFTTSPEVLSLFSKFQNLATEEEMRASEAFQEHGEKVLIIILMTMMVTMMMMVIMMMMMMMMYHQYTDYCGDGLYIISRILVK